MRTVSFIARTSLALSAAAFAAGSADAAIVVFDTFGAGAQTVTAAGSLLAAGSATNTSGVSASIAATAGSRNQRTSKASGDTAQNVAGLTNAEKSARFASTVINTSTGTASMSLGGRVSNAASAVQYLASVGNYMDFTLYEGVQLDGAMTSSSGFGFASVVNLDVILIDASGVTANYYFSANDANGGFTGADGLLSANFADFIATNPLDPFWTGSIDLSQIASFAVNFSYFDGSFGAASVAGSYQLGQISFNAVPAPGALALLAVAGVVGLRRRRT